MICALGALLTGCDRQAEIAVIKNNLPDTIAILPSDGKYYKAITDSELYNDRIYIKDFFNPKESDAVALPNRFYHKAPDSVYVYLNVIDLDSLNFYKRRKVCYGVVKHCLLKTIKLQANKIKSPVDTIYIN
jgi:hypothetical protein